MKFLSQIAIIVVMASMLGACGHGKKSIPAEGETRKIEKNLPVFNADSAYEFVARQVAFGPRVTSSEASARCAAWITRTLRRYTPHVQVQAFKVRAYNGETLNGKNIIASFQPENKVRILLGAHWDSRPYADHDPDQANHRKPIDGANDGASGVGVLMEIARLLQLQAPSVGVDIVLFDAEDYGPPSDLQSDEGNDWWGLGSQYWSRNPHKSGYQARYGILLDMVGVQNPTFPMEGFSLYYAPAVVKKVWDIAAEMGYGNSFISEPGGYITDDHYYVNKIANIPMINIIHLERNASGGTFYPFWHTLGDSLDKVDKNSLQMVGNVLVGVIYSE
ncbi:MAG: M28 family peptidase [Bacteroidales bacterium]